MGHEGIQFRRREDVEADSREQRELAGAAVEPVKVRVNQTAGTGMEIDWRDGHKSSWTFPWLRDACPCALCQEERESSGRKPGEPRKQAPPARNAVAAPAAAPAAAPVAGRVVMAWRAPGLAALAAPPGDERPVKVEPVGRYAVRFKWSDGHQTGIYSWDYLRRVCQCDECQARRRAAE